MAKGKLLRDSGEVVNGIVEVLLRASGEQIEAVAKELGLNVRYIGDSLFEEG